MQFFWASITYSFIVFPLSSQSVILKHVLCTKQGDGGGKSKMSILLETIYWISVYLALV